MIQQYLPAPLLGQGPLTLLWWQWLALPIGLGVSVLAGRILGAVTHAVLVRVTRHTRSDWDDRLIERLTPPIRLLWAIATAYLLKLGLDLPDAAERHVDQVLKAATVAVSFWAGLRSIDLGFQAIAATPTARAHGLEQGLLPMLRKVTKIAVFAMAVIAVLTDLGYPVGSLLAGLGIGGLALALAAQKTVENLFGSVAINVDQPFRVGDFVRLESGETGTVEAIGLRSTRVRTLDRTVVTVPNGKLADQRVESFAVRDRCRLACKLPLVYGTTADQVRAVLSGALAVLQRQPRLWPEGASVRVTALAESSIDVEVLAWFGTADWNEFMVLREEVLLGLLESVERAGTSLAYPTRTVLLSQPQKSEGPARARPSIGGADRDRTDDL